eukprot:scaffold30266_cov33-Tisochrysis_lutea.AAC.1
MLDAGRPIAIAIAIAIDHRAIEPQPQPFLIPSSSYPHPHLEPAPSNIVKMIGLRSARRSPLLLPSPRPTAHGHARRSAYDRRCAAAPPKRPRDEGVGVSVCRCRSEKL